MNIKIEIHTDKEKILTQTLRRLKDEVDKVADDLFDGRVDTIETVEPIKIRCFEDSKGGVDDK